MKYEHQIINPLYRTTVGGCRDPSQLQAALQPPHLPQEKEAGHPDQLPSLSLGQICPCLRANQGSACARPALRASKTPWPGSRADSRSEGSIMVHPDIFAGSLCPQALEVMPTCPTADFPHPPSQQPEHTHGLQAIHPLLPNSALGVRGCPGELQRDQNLSCSPAGLCLTGILPSQSH